MPGMIKKTAVWLGLVSDDQYDYSTDDADYSESVFAETEAVELHKDEAPANVASLAGHKLRSVEYAPEIQQEVDDLSRIITVHPRTYSDARTIGEHFRDGVPVIMNLTDMEDSDAKRLVDFAAGLIFGVRGTIERVTSKVFLLCPPNVNVTAEDKVRLAGEFFNQS